MNDLFTNKSKDEIAIERLRAFEPKDGTGYYCAFSGGKDSIVILDLLKRSGCKFDAHYNVTTVDPPQLVKFIKTFPEVQFNYPEMSMWKLIVKKRMPPTRIARYCCTYLKETNGAHRFVVTGIRWAESYGRSKRKMVEACFKDDRRFYVRPIIDWSTEDVWQYIKSRNLRYCSLYDEGFDRIGCIGCPMAGREGRLKEFKRWPKYKAAYIKAFDRCIEKRITDGMVSENWSSGQEMFDWWISDRKEKQDPDQTVMFE